MAITSFAFLGFVIVYASLFNLARGQIRSHFIFPIANLIFLWLVMPNVTAVWGFLLFVFVVWIATHVVSRLKSPILYPITIFMIVFLFGVLKKYQFLTFLPFISGIPRIIGLSYVLIRSLQLIVDVRDGSATKPALLTLFNFLVAWPTLISGPIQRFQDSESQQKAMATFELGEAAVDVGLRRIARGFLFLLVLAEVFRIQWLNLVHLETQQSAPVAMAGAQAAFLVHLFFNFSGYTDVVIGTGYLVGLNLPENFDRPWLSTSFLDFWSRWHMTMSNWFKAYVFNPLLLFLFERWPDARLTEIHGLIAFFITFFLVGLWHGPTTAFIICGLLLGLGASVNHVYRTYLRRWLGKSRFDRLCADPRYMLACAILGLAYICFSVTPLWMTFEEILTVVHALHLSGIIIAWFALIGLSAVVVPLFHLPSKWFRVPFSLSPRWATALQVGAVLVAVDIYSFLSPTLGGALFYGRF
jgi:alginate O-acetyltransferase complex protein AlgI